MLTSKRTVSTNSFVVTIAANIDNQKLSDSEFRTFIHNTLPVVKYTKNLKQGKKVMENYLTGSETIFGFCAWLTTRKEKTVMSSSEDAAPIVELIKRFCEENKLPDPRENYTDYLTMPKE